MSKARTLADYVGGGTTATEFDVLDGLTSTTAELNILDGVTSTAAELNHVDGVTSNVQTQLNAKAPLASPALTGTATAVNLTVSGDLVPSTPMSHRNIIINGAMGIAQRSSVAFAHDGTIAGYSEVDRYRLETDSLGEWDGTLTQHDMTSAELNTTGFAKALKLTTGTAESSIGSNDIAYITQKIEAQNLQHLQYGTASAKTVTLSFWVKTSVAGTYSVGLYKSDSSARNITATYTTTGTGWEYKTITFAGDTDATATIVNDNGEGLRLFWNLASGSTYDSSENTSWHNYANASFAGGHAQDGIITTASATFLLTGVQLELGSSATQFEHRSYGDELQRCMRYYETSNGNLWGYPITLQTGLTYRRCPIYFKVRKRSAPTTVTSSANVTVTGHQSVDIDGFTAYFDAIAQGNYCEVSYWTAYSEL
jgi:hypothetical protein